VAAVHEALAVSLHAVFVGVLPLLGVAIVASLLLPELPLRTSSVVDVPALPLETPEPGSSETNRVRAFR
jgi:hypothetical protein